MRYFLKQYQEGLNTEYFCNTTDTIFKSGEFDPIDPNESNIVELINVVPEQITIGGAVTIDGAGRLSKGSDVWGNINLIAPLSISSGSNLLP